MPDMVSPSSKAAQRTHAHRSRSPVAFMRGDPGEDEDDDMLIGGDDDDALTEVGSVSERFVAVSTCVQPSFACRSLSMALVEFVGREEMHAAPDMRYRTSVYHGVPATRL